MFKCLRAQKPVVAKWHLYQVVGNTYIDFQQAYCFHKWGVPRLSLTQNTLHHPENMQSHVHKMVTNLRYADDTTLLAGTKEDLIELVERVRRASENAGLYLNVGGNEGDGYRRRRRGDSGWEGYRGSNKICFLGSADSRLFFTERRFGQ